jgi:hypothetical protein
MLTHRRQAAIRIANNQNIAKTMGTDRWHKHPHLKGVASFNMVKSVDVINTYNACARGHACRTLTCPRTRHASIHYNDLGIPHSRWRTQCPDMQYMSMALAQHLVYFHGDAVGMPCMGHRRARNGNALQHMVGGVVMVRGNFWAGCVSCQQHTLFPCKVLDVQKQHRWPDGTVSRAYHMVVVEHRTSAVHAPGETPFWMRHDACASFIEAGLRMTDAAARRVLHHLQAVAPKGRTHITAYQHMAIQPPWNQPGVVVRAHPFQDSSFHGRQHRPFVMILGETYTDKPSAFDFAQCRDDVEIGMVVVFFKVRM